jgi:hypothetical protein
MDDAINSCKHDKRLVVMSLFALGMAGVYSIVLVMLRSPIFAGIIDKSVFNIALVVHVDLSVLIWMSAVLSIIIIKHSNSSDTHDASSVESTQQIVSELEFLKRSIIYGMVSSSIVYTLYLSVLCICISPLTSRFFLHKDEAFLNNYVPMFNNIVFIIGIGFFVYSSLALGVIGILSYKKMSYKNDDLNIGWTGGVIILTALVSLYVSYIQVRKENMNVMNGLDPHEYYEHLFWGFGHVMQFMYVHGAVFIWLKDKASIKVSNILLLCNMLLVLPLPVIQYFCCDDYAAVAELFTMHMRYYGGIVPAICIMLYVYYNDRSVSNITLWPSVILFMFGCVIGMMIHQIDVTVPAHYHGCIVGISLAFMWFIYDNISKKYKNINFKVANWQMSCYAFGQIIHISALAWSGGYGALRKAPGVELSAKAKIAMSFMGLGGLIAVICGLVFVWVCSRALYQGRRSLIANSSA